MHEDLLAILTALQRLKLELCEEILGGRQQVSMMSIGTKQRIFCWETANVVCSFVYSSAAPRIGWLLRRSTFGPHIYPNPYSAIPSVYSYYIISAYAMFPRSRGHQRPWTSKSNNGRPFVPIAWQGRKFIRFPLSQRDAAFGGSRL